MTDFIRGINTLYLDCDGVLADFDFVAEGVLGMKPTEFEDKHGSDEFWGKLGKVDHFYASLPLMHDALELYDAVKHMRPVILTGAPKHFGEDAIVDKYRWIAEKFGVFQRGIVCQSKHKFRYCIPGDIIVDDTPRHRRKWEEVGGTWVHHVSAEYSIAALREMGIIE